AAEPSLDERELALAEDDATPVCMDDPEAAFEEIEQTYGAGSPEATAGLSCLQELAADMSLCDFRYHQCLAESSKDEIMFCAGQYQYCRRAAELAYWDCLQRGLAWWCGFYTPYRPI